MSIDLAKNQGKTEPFFKSLKNAFYVETTWQSLRSRTNFQTGKTGGLKQAG
jgi:hypothetical protein